MLRCAKLILRDEAPMMIKLLFVAVEQTLLGITYKSVILLSKDNFVMFSDIHQALPVVTKGLRPDIAVVLSAKSCLRSGVQVSRLRQIINGDDAERLEASGLALCRVDFVTRRRQAEVDRR